MADAAKTSYSLTLKGEGISVSRDVDQSIARAIMELVLGGVEPPRPGTKTNERASSSPTNAQLTRLSLREFLDQAEPKRNPDKIVAIGEYIIQHDKQPEFTRDDVKTRFRNAGEPVPANFPRDFTWAISNGWIAEDAHNAGQHYVTQKGKTAIAEKFSGEVKKKSGFKPSGRRRRRSSRPA
jgi:hypothetical protein